MRLKSLFYIFLFFAFNNIYAQNHVTDSLHNEHDHGSHKNELGIANSPVYLLHEKNFCYGLHIHYLRNISDSRFGFGFGFERIFDEHKHNTFGLVAKYMVIDELSFNISPGIMLEDENLKKINFALHLETEYEFDIDPFCIGPVVECAFDAEDIHLSIGLHFGIVF
ncbi:MAG: hypothetical protein HY951_11230 [Bacteroidia bacterium]|nr:hypothetical protein [Bacteroidia bacterium]